MSDRPNSESWVGRRWRQFRNPPPPVLRAVLANLAVGVVGGALLVAYDVAISRGAQLPGGDLRTLASIAFVAVMLVCGSVLTYLWVEEPGARRSGRRSPWSALLGFFAAVPVAYLVLVVCFAVIRPLIA